MMFTPIDRRLVHKHVPENVFLSNLRRLLPSAIDRIRFEEIVQSLDDTQRQLLESAYRKVTDSTPFGEDEHYLMREVLGALHLDEGLYDEIYQALPDEYRKMYAEAYQSSDDGYRLKQPLTDDILRRIIRLGHLQEYYIGNEQQTRISDMLDGHPALANHPKPDIYFANVIIEASHSYFFEHPNEHVPGMMVLEAARQLVIASSHKFGGVPMHGSHLILDMLEARFSGYLEIYAPILLRGELVQKREHHGAWSSIVMEITIHQNSMQMGSVHCSGSNISSGVFERIRRIKREEMRTLPFIPSEDLSYNLLLKNSRENVWREARIKTLNLSGFSVDLGMGVSELPAESFDFVLVCANLGLTKGVCHPVCDEGESCRFAIENLSKSEEDQLSLILKRYCKVPEEVAME